jgi:hypothetical protein
MKAPRVFPGRSCFLVASELSLSVRFPAEQGARDRDIVSSDREQLRENTLPSPTFRLRHDWRLMTVATNWIRPSLYRDVSAVHA